MKIIAWNVNGMRSMSNNATNELNLLKLLKDEDPDIICFGETKLSNIVPLKHNELLINLYQYKYISNSVVKKGYSGTAIFSKKKPIDVKYGLLKDEFIEEGRVITLEFSKYFLVHCYTPNSGEVLARLPYRVNIWDQEFKKYLTYLQKIKPIIVCGDLNVANNDIDIHDPSHNKKSAGFTIEERNSFKSILTDLNLTDCYRYFYPNKIEYSYWSYRRNARNNNKGWRIDYFLVSNKLLTKIKSSEILTHIMGSDHAPITLLLK